MKAPITYLPLMKHLADKAEADAYGEALDAQVEWVRRDDAPRQEAFYCRYPTTYFYGTVDHGRSYDANTNIPPLLGLLWSILELEHGVKYEACFLNKYEHGNEHLGWHADRAKVGVKEGIDHTRPIAVISFGAERELWFRENPGMDDGRCGACNGSGYYDHNGSPKCVACNGTGNAPATEIEKLTLNSGSLCLMLPGMQHTHQHRIPKAGRVVGTRVSLTFRGLLPSSRVV